MEGIKERVVYSPVTSKATNGAEIESGEWLRNSVAKLAGNGWRCVPCRIHVDGSLGAAAAYADGQKYPLNHPIWHRESTLKNVIAVILDNAILLDYDGNKADTRDVIGLDALAQIIGEPLGSPHQIRESNNSIHWLYRVPDGFNQDEYKHSQDGKLAMGIDIKRGNQPVYIKSDKQLPHGGTIPAREDLPLVPSAILQQLKKSANHRPQVDCAYQPTDETSKLGAWVLNSEIQAFNEQAREGNRNSTLNITAFTLYRLVAGGEIAEHDAEGALEMAGESSGLDTSEVLRVLDSAKKAAYKQPRRFEDNVIGMFDYIQSSDNGERLPHLPDVGVVEVDANGIEGELLDPGYIDFPHKGSKGKVLNTSLNLQCVLNAHGIKYGYNLVSKRVIVQVPGLVATSDEYDNAALTRIEDYALRCGMTGAKIPQQVLALAASSPFNPFIDYVKSQPWDGLSRLNALADTITTSPDKRDLWRLLLRRWLCSVIASQIVPGFSGRGCLTLQGEQGKGKTSWFRRLFSDVSGVFADGITLNLNNKDSITEVLAHVCVELGELGSTFKKSEIDGLKAFITRSKDEVRRPYAVSASRWERRTVFCATVNDEQFLADDTGNSRFWCVPAADLDYTHGLDMQQVWAEVLALVNAGERWYLDAAEEALLTESNKAFEIVDAIEETLRATFDTEDKRRPLMLTATQVLKQYCSINNPNRAQSTKAGKVLNAMGFKSRKSNGVKVYDLPQPWDDLSSNQPE